MGLTRSHAISPGRLMTLTGALGLVVAGLVLPSSPLAGQGPTFRDVAYPAAGCTLHPNSNKVPLSSGKIRLTLTCMGDGFKNPVLTGKLTEKVSRSHTRSFKLGPVKAPSIPVGGGQDKFKVKVPARALDGLKKGKRESAKFTATGKLEGTTYPYPTVHERAAIKHLRPSG